jgi:hypothetical protein
MVLFDENDPINGNELVFTKQKPYVMHGYRSPQEKSLMQDPMSTSR